MYLVLLEGIVFEKELNKIERSAKQTKPDGVFVPLKQQINVATYN